MTRRAVHLADVAGVAHSLTRALNEHSGWVADQIDLSNAPGSSSPVGRAMALPRRIASVISTTRRATSPPRPDIAHLHWARFSPFVRPPVPLVVHAHGSDVRGRRGPQSQLVNAALRRAALVLVSTPDLLEDVPARAVYLPNPVDTDFFTPDDDAPTSDPPTVFLFARLSDVKGADDLITAARLIRDRRSTHLVAIGAGEHVERARAAGVTIIPPADRAAVRHTIRRSSVIIGQQRLGAIGLAELESMACGRPVVMRLRPGLYDDAPVIRATGPESIAHEVESLLDDPNLARSAGMSARAWVVRHHSYPTVAANLVRLYEEVLS